MKRLASLRDRYVIVGALGALLALSVVLMHIPATIYGGNAADLAFGLADFLIVAALLLIPVLAIVTGILLALPPEARRFAAAFLCALGLVFWLYGNFSVGDSLVMDGRHRDVRFSTWLGSWELLVLFAGALVVGVFAVRFPRPSAFFLAALNIGLAAGTTWQLVRDPRFLDPMATADSGKLFRFSTKANTLVVLMDSLQSDVFDRVVRADPQLQEAFQGFTLYRNTVGVAPTTLLSIPAIHSGLRYQPGESMDRYYDRAIAKGSLLNRFSEAGHEATLVNTMRGVCPALATCFEPVHIVGSRAEELSKSSLRMLDFSLLRVAPFVLKPHIFNDQRWLLSSRWQYSIFVDNIVHGNALLQRLASTASVAEGPPTVKFVHLMNTHAPFILLEDCKTFSENLLLPLPDAQVSCGLRAFATLLDRLRKDGLYEAATIALIADHGYALPSGYQRAEDRWGPWGTLMGAANPVLLLKRAGAQGALQRSDRALTIADTASLVCESARVNCALPSSFPPAGDVPRQLMWYRWEDIGWSRAHIGEVELGGYTISGPVWDRASWRHSNPLPSKHRLGTPIGFMPGDPRPELSPLEWSIAQTPGTWTEGHTANVAMNFGEPPAGDVDLEADAYAFLPPQRPVQHVIVLANATEVARWRFDAADHAGLRHARIPKATMPTGVLRVTFQMPDAVSPLALGLSNDPRALSLGLRRLIVTAAADAHQPSSRKPVSPGKSAAVPAPVRTSIPKGSADGKR